MIRAMPTLKRDGFLGLCAACAGASVVTAPLVATSAQTPQHFYPTPPDMTRLERVQVEQVDLLGRRLMAIDRRTGKAIVVPLEPGTLINGKHNNAAFRSIQSGDLVDVKLVPLHNGTYAVRELTVNIWVGNVLVTGVSSSGFTFQSLDYKTDKPIASLSPHDGYMAPKFARPQKDAVVELLTTVATLPIGAHVKLFGYKPPASAVVSFFRAEQYK